MGLVCVVAQDTYILRGSKTSECHGKKRRKKNISRLVREHATVSFERGVTEGKKSEQAQSEASRCKSSNVHASIPCG
jgi:hypothetical protein